MTEAAARSILTLNAGSSSLKFALFDAHAEAHAIVRGEIENLSNAPHFVARDQAGAVLAERTWPGGDAPSFDAVLGELLDFTDAHLAQGGLAAVGHRVVHGGRDYVQPALVTPDLLAALDALTPLDPLHMPLNVAPMRAVAAARPGLQQVACFDTAFHHTLPPVAVRFALPRALEAEGVRRYGFHGLSYEYIAGRLGEVAPALARGNVIVAHLGAGASLCALQGGRSIETTTGFSALDGLVMATRSGRLDPGVLLYLARQGHSVADIEDMLYRHSGMLGISGLSGDVRTLLASQDPHAGEAIESFIYRMACEVGSLTSVLGGLDGLVFTAGIGEHAPAIRAALCARLAWLGLRMDEQANQDSALHISSLGSAVAVLVIPTDEEAIIARHTRTAIQAHPG
jgi:acetate kinase